jgi:3-methyladenine DNA glycosylase AlkC
MSNTMFKDIYTKESIEDLAIRFESYHASFNTNKFIDEASKDIDKLEMKERINQIARAISEYLPKNYPKALKIVLKAMQSNAKLRFDEIRGFLVWPLCQFVEDNGISDFDISLDALYEMTKHFTSEVPIRAFLIKDKTRVLKRMKSWVKDDDVNVRRLVSEGLRPRLPWAQRLPMFIESPEPVINLLEQLKNDEELYVRRSVSNCLNDISKDNPDIVLDTVTEWSQDTSKEMKQLIRHACRTLIKQGHPRVFPILGYSENPRVTISKFGTVSDSVALGEDIIVEASLMSESNRDQKLVVDYIIHHVKANGKTSPKVYKWTTVDLAAGENIIIRKTHKFRPVTVRKYYAGEHYIELLINGGTKQKLNFDLVI